MIRNGLIETFVKTVLDGDDALYKRNDHQTHNRLYKETVRIANEIMKADGSLRLLLPLLSSSAISVRSRIAALLLADQPEIAVPVLEECAKDSSLSGFGAKTLLEEFRAGRHNPNWWKK